MRPISGSVTFVLPSTGRHPSGGFRIVYEHANRLAARDCNVRLMHIVDFGNGSNFDTLHLLARYLRARWSADRDRRRWFRLHPEIEVTYHRRAKEDAFPESIATIATGWRTAPLVVNLPGRCGRKYYFIQSFEDWDGPTAEVTDTWRLPLRRIVVSNWLMTIAEELGVTADFVPNAIDHDQFFVSGTLAGRSGGNILFASLPQKAKGTQDVVAAINLLRQAGEPLEVKSFGRVDPSAYGLQKPYDYVEHPSQDDLRELYNWAGVFVNASYIEGWGLTLAEAAACGAALVVSDIGGHRELASEANALLFKPGDVSQIADHISTLARDASLRDELAANGRTAALRYDWQTASSAMVAALDLD